MPKISVIMGVYNNEDTLKEAIDSIIDQSYTDWNFIICDDGSTDDSYNILLDYKITFQDKFIILKNEKNNGLQNALNKCLKYAESEYIAIMDGDDISHPERFIEQLKFLEDNQKYSFVSAGIKRFNDKGDVSEAMYKEHPQKRDLCKSIGFCHPCTMIKSSAMKEIGGYRDNKYSKRVEDYLLFVDLYANGYKGYNMQKVLLDKRENELIINKVKFRHRVNLFYANIMAVRKLKQPWYMCIFATRSLLVGMLPKKLYLWLHFRKIYRRK